MKIASHQINLLPYPAFWNRMHQVDIYDFGGLYDGFSSGSDAYHHRVKVGTSSENSWLTLPINKDSHKSKYVNISIKSDPTLMIKFWNKVEGTYRHYPYWKETSSIIKEAIFSNPTNLMWELNYRLIITIRDLLRISTPLSISSPSYNDSPTMKIVEQLRSYSSSGHIIYLAGSGCKNYLDESLLVENDIELELHQWNCPDEECSNVSILTMLFKYGIEETSKIIKS